MIHDVELEQILQNARESYSDRFKDIRSSLKTISGSRNDRQSDFLPGDYSIPAKTSQISKNHSKNFETSEKIDLKNSKDFLNHVKGLETTIKSLKMQNELAEEANFDLRNRLKDAALNMKKVQDETIKPAVKETCLDEKNLRYKKKISELKMRISEDSVKIKKIAQELEEAKKLEDGIKEICKHQVAEISEEFAFKLKQTLNKFTQEYLKLKEKYFEETEELLHENHLLKEEMSEMENRFKHEIKIKEQEIIVIDQENMKREEEVKKIVSHLKSQHQIELESLKRKFDQLKEENFIRISQNEQLNSELEAKNKKIISLKTENDSKNIENSRIPDSMIEQIIANNKNLQQKLESLELKYKTLASTHENLKESLRNSEVSLRLMKTNNETQANEILRLNKQFIDTQNTHEVELKHYKREFQSEIERKTQEFKQKFSELNKDYNKIVEKLEESTLRLEESIMKTKELEQYIKDSEMLINQLKSKNFHLTQTCKKHFDCRETLRLSTRKLKNFYQVFTKSILQQFTEISKFFNSNSEELKNLLEFSMRDTKSQQQFQLLQLKNEFSLTFASLEKANSQIVILQQESKIYKTKIDELESKKQTLEKMVNDLNEKKVTETQSTFSQIAGYLESLEEEAEGNYEWLVSSINDLKNVFRKEIEENNSKYFRIISRLEESLEDHKNQVRKLEFQKTAETNKSNSELLEIEQKLIQTLKEIRN
jgi:DNA repair exonuclease SbcCD ATPase subunit